MGGRLADHNNTAPVPEYCPLYSRPYKQDTRRYLERDNVYD